MPVFNPRSDFPGLDKMFVNNLVSANLSDYYPGGILLQLFYYPPLHVSETDDLTAMRFNLYAQVEDAIAHARVKFDVLRIDVGIINEPAEGAHPATVEAHLYLTISEKEAK
jgi:hypothetical protein